MRKKKLKKEKIHKNIISPVDNLFKEHGLQCEVVLVTDLTEQRIAGFRPGLELSKLQPRIPDG